MAVWLAALTLAQVPVLVLQQGGLGGAQAVSQVLKRGRNLQTVLEIFAGRRLRPVE